MTAGAPGAVACVAGAFSPWPGPALVLLGPARKGRVLIPVWAGWLRKSARMQKVLEEQQWSRENRRSGPFEEVLSRLLLSGVRKLRKVSNCGSRSRSLRRTGACVAISRRECQRLRAEVKYQCRYQGHTQVRVVTDGRARLGSLRVTALEPYAWNGPLILGPQDVIETVAISKFPFKSPRIGPGRMMAVTVRQCPLRSKRSSYDPAFTDSSCK